MRHAGIGFPNGPASLVSVFDLPSPNLLMLVTEARFHHDEAIRAGKSVLWRAIPNRGRRPAEVGWSPARAVDEALNLTDTAREPIRDFMPWNELDLRDERGDGQDDYSDLERRYNLLGGFLFSALTLLRQRLPGTRLHFPAFTPDHDALLYVDRWRAVAELADVVDFHAYDSLDTTPTATPSSGARPSPSSRPPSRRHRSRSRSPPCRHPTRGSTSAPSRSPRPAAARSMRSPSTGRGSSASSRSAASPTAPSRSPPSAPSPSRRPRRSDRSTSTAPRPTGPTMRVAPSTPGGASSS
jgi:hypothetical protein